MWPMFENIKLSIKTVHFYTDSECLRNISMSNK